MHTSLCRQVGGSTLRCCALAAASLAYGVTGWACEAPIGRLVSAEAAVDLRPAGSGGWVRIAPPQPLCEGDQVAVRSPGRAAIVLEGDILVRLDQDTTLQLTRVAPPANAELGLAAGLIHVFTRFRQRFEVGTPFVNALVEGTEFTVSAAPGASRIVVAEGRVRAHNAEGERALAAGDAVEASAGAAPAPIAVAPLDAVRWAIHYPQIVWLGEDALATLPRSQAAAVEDAQRAMAGARYADALATLERAPDDTADPRIQTLRASLLLALGRIDQAQARIDLLADAADATAVALEAVIRVARNDGDGALAAARRAIDLDAGSAATQLALSYALQARRNPQGALAAASAATRLAPAHPFAWARRAELALSLAQREQGRAAAAEALAHAPALPRARALLGFAQLLDGETARAGESFAAAIAADATDPLARFGSGLAHVRRGELAAGRAAIEIAVLLDPSNAELRSYLGRVYVEEDRAALGGEQFALARRLDPASPTPWFFEAFRKLRDNDPLGALADGQRAIALNDNRAVFRSSELLDSDRAARSASLGEAYREVGFDQPMLAAAMRALDDDPMSAAGHRLLADAYAELPRFETARVSELFQAQVRQPIGQWPVPPQFLSRNLPIVDGPRALAPEEASALFNRKASHFAASLLGGSDDTWGDSLVASRSWERAQVSLGHFDYRREGFRDGGDVDLTGTRLGAQFAPAPDTMIHGELGYDDRSGGDVAERLLEGAGLAWDQRLEQDVRTSRGRLSVRHAPTVTEEYIVTAGGQDTRERTLDRLTRAILGFDVGQELEVDTHLHSRELGVLYGTKGTTYALVAGAHTYRENRRQTTLDRLFVSGFPDQLVPGAVVRSTMEHNSAFAYLDLHPARWAAVHLGASYTALDDGEAASLDRASGKAGVVMNVTPATTLRLALIQGVKAFKFEDQSLEPTQFAGFNQVFDDLDGTRWRRTAARLDHRFDSGITAGLEWSGRALEVPGLGCDPVNECRADWSERLHHAHLAVPLSRSAAFLVSWRYERLRLNEDPSALRQLPYLTRTEILPVGLWLKLGPRLSTRLEAVRVRQQADVTDALFGGADISRSERFWLANGRLSYVRPGRSLGVSLAVFNVFDRRFAFQDTDISGNPKVPLFFPSRTVLVQANVQF